MSRMSPPWRNRFAGALACALLAGCAVRARAQTDYSLRSRALAGALAGIVDSPITDASLNPSRLGAPGGRFVYAGMLPTH